MYCEKCRIVFDAARCPRCGNRHVREAEAEDLCLLTEKEVLWSEMVEDAMRDAGIPCLAKGKLTAHLTEIDRQATEMVSSLTAQMARSEGVTESMKATDQMLWVQSMNNIRQRAEEIATRQLIYN